MPGRPLSRWRWHVDAGSGPSSGQPGESHPPVAPRPLAGLDPLAMVQSAADPIDRLTPNFSWQLGRVWTHVGNPPQAYRRAKLSIDCPLWSKDKRRKPCSLIPLHSANARCGPAPAQPVAARPPVFQIIAFINESQGSFGVEPICGALRPAPFTRHDRRTIPRDADRASRRAKPDAALSLKIDGARADRRKLYGARKISHVLR